MTQDNSSPILPQIRVQSSAKILAFRMCGQKLTWLKVSILFLICLFSVGLSFQQHHLLSMKETSLFSRHYLCQLNFTDNQTGSVFGFQSKHIRRMLPTPVEISRLLRREVGISTYLWLRWILPLKLFFIAICYKKKGEWASQTYMFNFQNPLSLGW